MPSAAAAAGASTRDREDFYLQLTSTTFCQLTLRRGAFADSGLLGALGLTKTKPTTGNMVGTSKEDALTNGAVPVVLVYKGANGKNQTAKVLCAPSKADTIFADGANHKYAGRDIVKVRFPRRRVYVI